MGARKWLRLIDALVTDHRSPLVAVIARPEVPNNLGVSGIVRRGDCRAAPSLHSRLRLTAMTNWHFPPTPRWGTARIYRDRNDDEGVSLVTSCAISREKAPHY